MSARGEMENKKGLLGVFLDDHVKRIVLKKKKKKGLCYFWTKSKVLSLNLKWITMSMMKILLPKNHFVISFYFFGLNLRILSYFTLEC